jgi:hypothetical protein
MKSSSGESANPHEYHTKIGKKRQALNVTNVDDNHLNLGREFCFQRFTKTFSHFKRIYYGTMDYILGQVL